MVQEKSAIAALDILCRLEGKCVHMGIAASSSVLIHIPEKEEGIHGPVMNLLECFFKSA